jgi:hypothetical protein
MFICFLYITDQWLKRGTSSKPLSTTTASTDVTDTVTESQCFRPSFSADSSRTAESKKSKRMIPTAESKKSKRMIPMSLELMYTGDETARCPVRLVQQSVTKQFYVT